MPVILVHGVPDTHHVWDGVRSRLTRTDVKALAGHDWGRILTARVASVRARPDPHLGRWQRAGERPVRMAAAREDLAAPC
ncbi:hypothetical protein [Streptomyces sp. NRRL S-1521]|uniref:hypothetical protein n=1 Tax=Streptomyces sp. NRRL S-1521 TaxID=1609100 RepID=UPI000A5AF1A7|nr:hypothetical protein [Streptomyces sp. NRRL S-1521]